MNKNAENKMEEPDVILEFTRDDFIRGMESAGLQLSDKEGAPLKEIQANIQWASKLPEDAIIKWSKKQGKPFRELGKISLDIDNSTTE